MLPVASELPEGIAERQRLASLDDADVVRLAQNDEELLRRVRFERAWLGQWDSTPRTPKEPTISQEFSHRERIAELMRKSKSQNKVERAAAKAELEQIRTSYR